MLPDRVSNPGPLTYESGALPIALRGPARSFVDSICKVGYRNLSVSLSSLTPLPSSVPKSYKCLYLKQGAILLTALGGDIGVGWTRF